MDATRSSFLRKNIVEEDVNTNLSNSEKKRLQNFSLHFLVSLVENRTIGLIKPKDQMFAKKSTTASI